MRINKDLKQKFKLDHKHSKKVVIGVLAIIGTALLLGNFLTASDTKETDFPKPVVTLTTSREFFGDETLSVIGKVRALDEAIITTEVSGRVTSVNTELGQTVYAGKILVTLENASERAAVLQAQGVYEAALASAAQSNVGADQARTILSSARDSGASTFKSAYNTTNGVIHNSIDSFFASPNARVPGLRIDGQGHTAELNSERVAYQILLSDWLTRVNSISTDSNLNTELDYAKQIVQRTIRMIDTFIYLFNNQDNNSRYTDSELLAFSSSYTSLRSTLIFTESSIDTAINGLQVAADGLEKAELGATGGPVSAADAQVKQAQGALASAQSNLSKTILRAPIGGTINSISVRVGDFTNSFVKIAEVANNSALEIITYVSDIERDLLKVGDEVTIENEFIGIVTQIAPTINSETRKTEVRITTEGTDIDNGDTVIITKDFENKEEVFTDIFVPLTAIKFNRENGFMFSIENNQLIEKPVVLGAINGGSVLVKEGLTSNDNFVLDVRGLVTGEEVQVK